jgi:porin
MKQQRPARNVQTRTTVSRWSTDEGSFTATGILPVATQRFGCASAEWQPFQRGLAPTKALLLAILPALAAMVACAAGEETNPPPSGMMAWMTQDYMLGTWGGLRTDLSKHGVDFEFFYIASNPRNISGGFKTGSAYEGAFLMLLDLDSQKLVGYEGGHFHVGGDSIHGEANFSANHIGDLNKVNLIDLTSGWRLWELWYEQKFFNDKVSLKFGQMAVDQDFLMAEYYNSLASINLMNQTFFYPTLAFNVYNIPGFPGANHALASSPDGAPGVRLKYSPTDRLYFQAAAYDGYPDFNNGGTEFKLDSSEGALLYFETGYRMNQRKEDTGLPGNIKLGGYYHTSDYPDNKSYFQSQLGLGTQTYHPNTWGAYLLFDQTLYREKDNTDPAHQGLVGFFRLTGAPPDRNLTQFGVDGGLAYKGLIPSRDWDSLALAASYLEMSDDIRSGQELINSYAPGTFAHLMDYEGVVELCYKAQVTAWWTISASVQRTFHPGGSGANPDAWVLILGSTLRF